MDPDATDLKCKVVLIIHGMGDNRKNALLYSVVNSLTTWIDIQRCRERLAIDAPLLDVRLKETKPSSITLSFADQCWKFMDVWWAKSFDAPGYDPMIGWTTKRIWDHLRALIGRLAWASLLPLVLLIGFALTLLLSLVASFIVIALSVPGSLIWQIARFVGRASRNDRSPAGSGYEVLRLVVMVVVFGVIIYVYAGDFTAYLYGDSYRFRGAYRILYAAVTAIVLVPMIQVFVAIASARAMKPTSAEESVVSTMPESSLGAMRAVVEQATTEPNVIFRSDTPASPLYYFSKGPLSGLVAWTRAILTKRLNELDEGILLERLLSPDASVLEKGRLGCLLVLLIVYHFLNAAITIMLYLAALVLFIPLMFALWTLSLLSVLPRIPEVVQAIRRGVDGFLVGSLGDIKVFTEDPVQARRIRAVVYGAIDEAYAESKFNNAPVYCIAHSTGAPIAYESIIVHEQESRSYEIKGLTTVGAIMNMVWRMSPRSPFNESLPAKVRWTNIWSPYDPARAGPIDRPPGTARKPDAEKSVSNEGDPFMDHTIYWSNQHQVAPAIMDAIMDDNESELSQVISTHELDWTERRKWRLILLSGSRLIGWMVLPLTLAFLFGWLPTPLHDWLTSAGNALPTEWANKVSAVLVPGWLSEATSRNILIGVEATLAAQLIHRFLRAVLWDGVLREAVLFRP